MAGDVRYRLPGTALRRDRVWSPGRYDRAQIHVPHHHDDYGLINVRHRHSAHRRDIRDYRSVAAAALATASRPGTRRRVWRCGNLYRGARSTWQAWLLHQFYPGYGNGRLLHFPDRDPRDPKSYGGGSVCRLGLAYTVPPEHRSGRYVAL